MRQMAEKIREIRESRRGEEVSGGSGIPRPVKVDARRRKELSRAVSDAFTENFFDSIPLDKLDEVLRSKGFLLVDEDSTGWSGLILGSCGHSFMRIGTLEGAVDVNGVQAYPMVDNFGVSVSWHKMESGRWEVTIYVT